MKITALVENTTKGELKSVHGLSLYIETEKHRILFDLGPDDTLFRNAERRGIDLRNVDIVIISHGHKDHGGALKRFLEINSSAKIYAQKSAFEPHYTKALFLKIPVGLDRSLLESARFELLSGDHRIDDELFLFVCPDTSRYYSPANSALFERNGRDGFSHEHSLILTENGKNVLIMGCGHSGVVNIMERAKDFQPTLCVGGFHLFNPVTKKTVSESLLEGIAGELGYYSSTLFYTCHCTGEKAFGYFRERVGNVRYLSCGEEIEA